MLSVLVNESRASVIEWTSVTIAYFWVEIEEVMIDFFMELPKLTQWHYAL